MCRALSSGDSGSDAACVGEMRAAAAEQLAGFATTAEEDEAVLEQGGWG